MTKKRVVKWFEAGKPLGWSADDSQSRRRAAALKARKGDFLAAGRALLSLANVQSRQNPEVSRKARTDALYFFAKHKQELKRR